MMPNLKIALAGVLFVLPVATPGRAAAGAGSLVAIEMKTEVNTFDGCTTCGCRGGGALEPGAVHDWWISFGLVRPGAREGWEAVAPASHCGSGSFKKAATSFRQTVGTPYVILDLSMTVDASPDDHDTLKTVLRTRKFSGFDERREPRYTRSKQSRTLELVSEGTIVLPLFVPTRTEQESFGIHEVLLQLKATELHPEPAASYGSISLSADVPGAEVRLDGGLAGRIIEGTPTLLKNVRAGTREIRVRDFSGREARRTVVVEKNGIVEATLNVLNLSTSEPRNDLVPIGKNPQGHEEYWRAIDGAMMVRIPPGQFLMGSPEGDGEADEGPQHRVHVSEFLIDKTEVTWRQFRKYAEAGGTPLPPAPVWGTPDNYPVVFVLWQEAEDYCEWVGGRLPTEAEWEKAARGTDGRTYPWGDAWDPGRCNSISGGMHQPASSGSYPDCVSPYGVLDMPGSMWEWCADWYGESYYAGSPSRDPKGPATGRVRVMRGGAWMSQPTWLRAAYRFKASPSSRNADHGFRCAHDAPE